jgi:hypothetical protein
VGYRQQQVTGDSLAGQRLPFRSSVTKAREPGLPRRAAAACMQSCGVAGKHPAPRVSGSGSTAPRSCLDRNKGEICKNNPIDRSARPVH